MSLSHSVGKSVTTNGITVSSSLSYTGVTSVGVSDTVAITTNFEVDIAFLVAKVVSIAMLSDQVLTIKTNSTGSPGDTITTVANDAYIWNTDSQNTLKFTADVTKLYITNASSAVANFSLQVLSGA